jgi:RNA recognition motif-containing protein
MPAKGQEFPKMEELHANTSWMQVVVHNLPWTCSWQQLKDAFVEAGVANIERADVIIDSSGRSRQAAAVPPIALHRSDT